MQSPAAQTVGLAVRRNSSTTTWPRSVTSTPISSRPMPAACERRPTDTSSFSARTSVPSSSRAVTPSSRYSVISATWRPRWTSTPSFSIRRWNWLAVRLSMPASSRGRISTIVILVPRGAKRLANSQPITPPPTTSIDSGTDCSVEDLVGGEDRRVVHVEARQPRGLGADADHQVVEGVALAVDHDRVAVHAALAAHHVHALALGGALHALAHAQHDLVLALHHPGEVERDLRHHQAVLVGAAHPPQQVGGRQQRLGGDAAPVEAGAAQLGPLDQGRTRAHLGRPQRRDVAGRAPAQHDDSRRARAVPPVRAHSSPLGRR